MVTSLLLALYGLLLFSIYAISIYTNTGSNLALLIPFRLSYCRLGENGVTVSANYRFKIESGHTCRKQETSGIVGDSYSLPFKSRCQLRDLGSGHSPLACMASNALRANLIANGSYVRRFGLWILAGMVILLFASFGFARTRRQLTQPNLTQFRLQPLAPTPAAAPPRIYLRTGDLGPEGLGVCLLF